MKIIEFKGGLGNQLFEYAHYLYLKDKYPSEKKWYAFFPWRELWQHNGLEIHRRFNVNLPKETRLSRWIGWTLFTINRKICTPYNLRCPFTSTEQFPNEEAMLQEGYWEHVKYIPSDFRFEYNVPELNEKNKILLEELATLRNSKAITPVAVHVRRGDYLTCDHPEYFAGICTEEYYNKAISYILETLPNPRFYFFSDDSDYVMKHFELPEKVVVDWNKGADSFLDMYLMSHFSALIIANSTFSFWGAQNNPFNPLVVCPPRFNNLPYDTPMAMQGWKVVSG